MGRERSVRGELTQQNGRDTRIPSGRLTTTAVIDHLHLRPAFTSLMGSPDPRRLLVVLQHVLRVDPFVSVLLGVVADAVVPGRQRLRTGEAAGQGRSGDPSRCALQIVDSTVSHCTTGFRLAAAVMMPTGTFMVLVIRSERPHHGL